MVAWTIAGDNLRGELKIWMDGRPHPSPNARHTEGGFTTGKWEGDTLTAYTTHLKAAWIDAVSAFRAATRRPSRPTSPGTTIS